VNEGRDENEWPERAVDLAAVDWFVYAKGLKRKFILTKALRRAVQSMLLQDWPLERIAYEFNLTAGQMARVMSRLDENRTKLIRCKPDSIRGKHIRHLETIADVHLKRLEEPASADRVIRAEEKIRKIMGLDAPEQIESRSLNVVVNQRVQQSLMADPEYQRLVMRLEEIERAATHQSVDASEVRRTGELRPPEEDERLVCPEAPGDPQSLPDGSLERRDHPTFDVHESAPWQERVSLGLVPGLLPGNVSRSGGDLGEL
jgi:hypothetical protein